MMKQFQNNVLQRNTANTLNISSAAEYNITKTFRDSGEKSWLMLLKKNKHNSVKEITAWAMSKCVLKLCHGKKKYM